MPPNIAIFQFMVSAVGLLSVGLKQKMKKLNKKAMARQLHGMPHLPSEKREGGSGSLRRRRVMKQPMERKYEDRSADMVREAMALRAAADPRLRRAMTTPNAMLTETALRGMFQPGETCGYAVSEGASEMAMGCERAYL